MRTLAERFWAKVDVRGPDECWPWKAYKHLGYGRIGVGGDRANGGYIESAHRIAYELLVGPIPPKHDIDHTCHNEAVARGECSGGECEHRGCENPAHLEPVTRRENTLRGAGLPAVNARKTHCLNGHAFTPENTYTQKDGRKCRACARVRQAAYMARLRSAA